MKYFPYRETDQIGWYILDVGYQGEVLNTGGLNVERKSAVPIHYEQNTFNASNATFVE